MHTEPHPRAGHIVTVKMIGHPRLEDGEYDYRIEDWWDHLTGSSWMTADGNPAAMGYGIRGALASLPIDDDVLYGHIGGFGYLVHVSELQQ